MQMAGANLQGCVEDVHKECRGSAKMATLGDVHPSDLSAEGDGTKRLQTRWPFTTRVFITRFQTTYRLNSNFSLGNIGLGSVKNAKFNIQFFLIYKNIIYTSVLSVISYIRQKFKRHAGGEFERWRNRTTFVNIIIITYRIIHNTNLI